MTQITIKFGELLLQEQVISAAQLGDALRWQVLYGVRLGRALIEMGYLSETVIGEMLSRKHGVPAATRSEMLSLEPQTIALLPAEIAVIHRAIPLGINGRQMRVAMSDPVDRLAVDIIAQETGTIVQPLVSPDLLTCIALEKYYGNRCSRNELPMPRSGSIIPGTCSGIATPQISFCSQIATDGIPIDVNFQESDVITDDLFEQQSEQNATNGVIELDPFSVQLASARNREEVADATIEYLAPRFHASALVMLRSNAMIGWRAASSSHTISCCNGATMPIGTSPALRSLLASNRYLGDFLPIPDHRPMFDALHLPPSIWLLGIPIIVQQKPVAALLAWGEQPVVEAAEAELLGLSSKISLALQMLLIRSKILSG